LKIVSLKKMSIPKVAVLVTGLAAAVMVATINPAPVAQAYSSNPPLKSCAGCHSGGIITAGTTATAPATVAPSASYSVTVTPVVNPAGGMSGYSIVPVAPATGSTNATGSSASYTATMIAPAAAGTYTYTVWTNQGPDGAGVVGTATYTITVGAAPTTVPPTTVPPTTVPPTTVPPTTVPPTTVPPTTVPPTTVPPTTVPPTTVPPTTVPPTTVPPTTVPPTTPAATTAPGAPTDVTAIAGNGEATVSWTAPVSDGGLPLVGYLVVGNDGDVLVPTDGTETTSTVTGLTNGTSYTFTVVAFNEGDNDGSPESAASNAVTPTGPAAATTTTAPAATATATTPAGTGTGTAVIPVGAPDTGAGGTSNSTDGPLVGLGGLALLIAGAGATMVARRRQQV
jgi:hypothetical protein